MKKIITIFLLCMSSIIAQAQATELAQLALNIEKLVQFKQILSDLKKAYDILYGGYTTIKNISEGNFNLHQTFLDGLLQVSPAVQKYKRIADIIELQERLVKEYKQAYRRFSQQSHFTLAEIDYIGKVYKVLFNESVANLNALLDVITAKKLRMSDDERLQAIDGIYQQMQNKLIFLRQFNSSTSMLGIQREKGLFDINSLRRVYALPQP